MIESDLLPQFSGYIADQWTGTTDEAGIPVTNPATGETLAEITKLGRTETLRAIDAAEASLSEPASLEQRREWLHQIVTVLQANREEIGRILTLEHGKPVAEAQGEVDYAAGFFRFCGDNIEQLGPRTIDEQPKDCTWTVHHRPAGVVGLVTPWNFPIGMIAKKLSAALAADCACVIKPSSKTPLTMMSLFTLIDRHLNLPRGKLNLVVGSANPITNALFEHSAVRIVSFTGSTEVGKHLIEQSATGVKRLTLELGGNAPYIVFEDADLDYAADQLMGNKFRGGGQTCVCANRVFVHQRVADTFAEKVTERVRALQVGDGMASGVNIGPLIDDNAVDKVRRHVQDALDKGAKRVYQGDTQGMRGTYYPPTVLSNVPQDALCNDEETFGPLVPLIPFGSDAELVAAANDTDFGLAAYVFTADTERGQRVIAQLKFAHAALNTGTGPTPEAPFGGMKQSGYGREGGIEGLFEFTEAQTVPVANR